MTPDLTDPIGQQDTNPGPKESPSDDDSYSGPVVSYFGSIARFVHSIAPVSSTSDSMLSAGTVIHTHWRTPARQPHAQFAGYTTTINAPPVSFFAGGSPTGSSSGIQDLLARGDSPGPEDPDLIGSLAFDTLPADQLDAAVSIALSTGMTRSARDLALAASAARPEDERMRRIARILGAPPAESRKAHEGSTSAADVEWLQGNASFFKGQWLAVKGGQLLAEGKSIDDIRRVLPSLEDALIVRIPE